MNIRESVKHFLRMCGHAVSSTVHDRLDVLDRQLESASLPETQAALLQAAIHSAERLEQLTNYTVVETSAFAIEHPEAGLIEFLYSYLPSRKALDLSADEGIAQCLEQSGYEVQFLSKAAVQDASHRTNGFIPDDIGLVRLGTSSGVPDAIRRNGDACYPVVIAGIEQIESLPKEMRGRGYAWYLAVYRLPGSERAAFYANSSRSVPNSGGSIFFFRDYSLFAQAQMWCSAVLLRTFFKPAS